MPKRIAKTVGYGPETAHYPATALPFYKDAPRTGNYWCLPATGEYYGGKDAGKAMALAYLKHMAETEDETPLLHYVAMSMRERMMETSVKPELEALHGQSIGFFTEICKFIRKAMTENAKLAKPFKTISKDDITKQANKGLRYTYRSG